MRRQGYAIDDVEMEEGVRCVGAPVFDHRNMPIAALSVSAPTSRLTRGRASEIGAIVCKSARGLSEAMGWTTCPRER